MTITIDSELLEKAPQAALLVLEYEADVTESYEGLLTEVNQTINHLMNSYQTADIATLPTIATTRKAYNAFGKSPSSYRNAAEAMLRRIVKGQGLYQINNIVDINNLMSISTSFSIGSYDQAALVGDIVWQLAPQGEHYQGIGKQSVNIEKLPTLFDETGAFGNPTSDSQRGMVTNGQHQIMSVVYSFDGTAELAAVSESYQKILEKYAYVNKVTRTIYSE